VKSAYRIFSDTRFARLTLAPMVRPHTKDFRKEKLPKIIFWAASIG
jgi:hypothetical protein